MADSERLPDMGGRREMKYLPRTKQSVVASVLQAGAATSGRLPLHQAARYTNVFLAVAAPIKLSTLNAKLFDVIGMDSNPSDIRSPWGNRQNVGNPPAIAAPSTTGMEVLSKKSL